MDPSTPPAAVRAVDPDAGAPLEPDRPARDAIHVPLNSEPRALRREDLTYHEYLRVDALLSLQQPLSDPEHHDEMLFIVIHQAYELWFKLVLREMERAIHYLRADHPLRARHFLARCVRILELLVQQIHILETMTPAEFLGFRDNLNPASGFQSQQFREIEFLAGLKDRRYLAFFCHRPELVERLTARIDGPDLRLELYAHLARAGLDLPDSCRLDDLRDDARGRARLLSALERVYSGHEDREFLPLYLLVESCLELDMQLGLWREHHVCVVERIIGRKRGTGGSSGVNYLRKTTQRRIFPYLWEVRTVLGSSPRPGDPPPPGGGSDGEGGGGGCPYG